MEKIYIKDCFDQLKRSTKLYNECIKIRKDISNYATDDDYKSSVMHMYIYYHNCISYTSKLESSLQEFIREKLNDIAFKLVIPIMPKCIDNIENTVNYLNNYNINDQSLELKLSRYQQEYHSASDIYFKWNYLAIGDFIGAIPDPCNYEDYYTDEIAKKLYDKLIYLSVRINELTYSINLSISSNYN